jgi:hypothetical protein
VALPGARDEQSLPGRRSPLCGGGQTVESPRLFPFYRRRFSTAEAALRGLRVYRDHPLVRLARAPFVYLPGTLQRTIRR